MAGTYIWILGSKFPTESAQSLIKPPLQSLGKELQMMGEVVFPTQLLPGKTAGWNSHFGKKCMKTVLAVNQYRMQIIYIKKQKR